MAKIKCPQCSAVIDYDGNASRTKLVEQCKQLVAPTYMNAKPGPYRCPFRAADNGYCRVHARKAARKGSRG